MSAWTLIRTLVAAVADAPGPPAAASGVALPANMSIVEFRVQNLVTTGNPTSLILFLWRIQTGTVELIGTHEIQTANNVMPDPKRVISESPDVYVTIGFTGGTNPTASGTIEARGLFGLTDLGIAVTPGLPSAWGLYQEDTAHTSGDWGENILAVRRDVPINSAGSDGDYCEFNIDADGYLYVNVKGYDAASNAVRVFETAPLWSRNVQTPFSLGGPITITTTTPNWVDVGPEIPLQGYTRITLWIDLDINAMTGIMIRCLGKHTSAGADEYSLPIYNPSVAGAAGTWTIGVEPERMKLNIDLDQKIAVTWDVSNSHPFVQFQATCSVDGGDNAILTTAYVTYGWGS